MSAKCMRCGRIDPHTKWHELHPENRDGNNALQFQEEGWYLLHAHQSGVSDRGLQYFGITLNPSVYDSFRRSVVDWAWIGLCPSCVMSKQRISNIGCDV